MEAQSGSGPIRITVLNGTHKGKTGLFVSKSEHYTKIQLEDDTVIRCKNAFAKGSVEHGPDHTNHMNEDDALLQEMILASLIQEENEQKKKAKEHSEMIQKQSSEMIQKQNAEYEASLKKDLAAQGEAKKFVFEEVSKEEMRRVRLMRFG
jgi:hypothetical protein